MEADLSPRVVGEIARGVLDPDSLTPPRINQLRFHGLAGEAVAVLDPTYARNASGKQVDALLAAGRQQTMRSMLVVAVAEELAAILEAMGLPVIIYKGPALAAQVAGTWRGRGSADVDALVAEGALAEVHSALIAAGLERKDGHHTAPGPFLRYRECERTYIGLASPVDLHWRIDSASYFTTSFSELWERRTSVWLASRAVTTLDPFDALLVTSVHGTRERWSRWRWALDAYRQLAVLSGDDWGEAVTRARRSGCLRALAMSLAVANACGLESPWIPQSAPRWRALATAWLAESSGHTPTSTAALHRRWGRWQTADTASAAGDGLARATARQLFPSSRTFTAQGNGPRRHLGFLGDR